MSTDDCREDCDEHVTCRETVEDSDDLTVIGSDGNEYPARMKGHPPALERICSHQWGKTEAGACKNCGLAMKE